MTARISGDKITNSGVHETPPGPPPKPTARLERITFRTSREMDFFSERELVTQTGHERREWPLVIVKELMDNALDACEEADVPPAVEVTADGAGIAVRDNGPGLPEATLRAAMDFSVRVSNRDAYVSPCRGAQGNALKTLLPMPRVVNPDEGRVVVTANGVRRTVRCGIDQVSQRSVVTHDTEAICKNRRSRNGDKALLFRGHRSPRGVGFAEGALPLAAGSL
jgi:hypothetical protein